MEDHKITKENAEEFMERVLRIARELGIEYEIVEDGSGGFYIENPDGSEEKLSLEQVLGIEKYNSL